MKRNSSATQPAPALGAVTASDIANLDNCIADVRRALADGDRGPADPRDFANLRGASRGVAGHSGSVISRDVLRSLRRYH